MITRFSGTCHYCKRPTRANVDHYSMAEKISFHYACRNEAPDPLATDTPTHSAEALAIQPGFEKVEL